MSVHPINEKHVDALGDKFINQRIGKLFGITFEQYVEHHETYDDGYMHLVHGGGICRFDNGMFRKTGVAA